MLDNTLLEAVSAPTTDPLAPIGSTATTRAQRAAERVGLETAAVEQLPFDLSALESEGVLVNVDARGFGLLDRRLDWQALGITLPRGADLAFRPPRCGLLPDRYRLPLLRPAARAHAALHKYSYRFTLVETLLETPAFRWVPWRAWEAFEREFQAAQTALAVAKTAVLEEYAAVREEVLEAFARLAEDSARRLAATGQAVPDEFAAAVTRGVLAALPAPEDLETRLTLRYRVGVLLLGSEMLAEQRRAREERERLLEAEGALRLAEQRQQARERVVQAELWAEQERLRRQLAAEEAERQREAAVKERLRQLKLEAARERLQEALSPLEEGARQLHAAVYDAASAIRASLQQRGHLHGATARKARELARWFRLMSWQSDAELETLLGELETLARRPMGKQRPDPGPLDEVLGDIIARCYADARALAEPHRLGALEL
jgi:hypothetical protein